MFGTQTLGARARYRDADIAAQVEGASPHRLIAILFDELLLSLRATAAAVRQGDLAKRGPRQARALSILHALETSLDFAAGGEIAEGLAGIYREARRLTLQGVQQNDPLWIDRARELVDEIAGAWSSIDSVRNG